MSSMLHRFAAWLLLVVIGLTGTGLAPVVVAGLAICGGEHEVRVESEGDGVRIVLHHPGQNVGSRHQHGWSTRLALLAAATNSTEQDHVTRFKSAVLLMDTKLKAAHSGHCSAESDVERSLERSASPAMVLPANVKMLLLGDASDGWPPGGLPHLGRGSRRLLL